MIENARKYRINSEQAGSVHNIPAYNYVKEPIIQHNEQIHRETELE